MNHPTNNAAIATIEHADAELVCLGGQLGALLPAIDQAADLIRIKRAAGQRFDDHALDALMGQLEEVQVRASHLRATTLAGISVKARIAAWWRTPAADHDGDDEPDDTLGDLVDDVIWDVLRLAEAA